MSDPVRVLIVDDHPVVRDGLRMLLDAAEGMECIGEAGDGETALALVQTTRPDVVVMDLSMPGIGGVEATRRVREISPDTAILILSMSEADASLFAAVTAGASGYVLKGAEQADLLRALRSVAHGDAVFDSGVAARALAALAATPTSDVAFPDLTTREREVLELMARGLDNVTIARRLVVSEKTVRNNVSMILTKLQVNNRAEAVARARDSGLGSPAGPG